jgi:hypothetical protein
MVAYVIKCSGHGHSRTFVYSADAKDVINFEILNHEGEITFRRAKTDTLNVTISVTRQVGYEKYFGDFEGRFSSDNGLVRYEEKITRENFWHWLGSCKSSAIVIDLPEKLADKANILASQDVGKIIISNIHSPLAKLTLLSKLGDLILSGVDSDVIEAMTHGGNVKFNDISGMKMVFSTNSGDIKLIGDSIKIKKSSDNNIRPYLDVVTNYGAIDLRGIDYSENSAVDVRTSVGEIQLKNINFGGHFEMGTKAGNVVITGDVEYDKNTKNEKFGSFGKGNSTLYAKTVRGDIVAEFK